MPSLENYKDMLLSQNPESQTTALYVLIHDKKKRDLLDEIVICTQSKNNEVRLAAVQVLEKIKNVSVIKPLEDLLNDNYPRIKIISAIALSKFENEKAKKILINIVQNDSKDHSLHKKVIESLGRYKEKKLIPIFKILLNHRRKINRIKAVDALLKINDKEAFEVLQNSEKNQNDIDVKFYIRNKLKNISYQINN